MYVICINDSFFNNSLTIGKVYKVIGKPYTSPFYDIENDRGFESSFAKDRFKVIKNNKINELLYKGLK